MAAGQGEEPTLAQPTPAKKVCGEIQIILSCILLSVQQPDTWKPVVSAVTSPRKFRWLKQRLAGTIADTSLMHRIAEFVLYDHPVDIENLRKSLHYQVERASIRLKGIQNILTLVHQDHLIPSVKYAVLSGWLGFLKRTISQW